MTGNSSRAARPEAATRLLSPPPLDVRRLGIVSRDYRRRYPNGLRDFSYSLPAVLRLLDEKRCDAVVFSLFSLVPPTSSLETVLAPLRNVTAVLLEEFDDGEVRRTLRNVVRHRTDAAWKEYELHQQFSRLAELPRGGIESFVANDLPKRIAGNCCILLCGESNGVPHSKAQRRVVDTHGLRAAIPDRVRIIINPIHDRMTRYELPLKRRFLSERNRWVVSVWNKGKTDRNGRVKDGTGPPWTVFHNGTQVEAERVPNDFDLDIGVVDTGVRRSNP